MEAIIFQWWTIMKKFELCEKERDGREEIDKKILLIFELNLVSLQR